MQINDSLAGTLAPQVAADAGTAGANTIDHQEFLTLLVTQLQNQDPLNPMESAEFSAQLAQFSSLEQLIQINQGIEALGDGGATDRFDALGLLGHEVRVRSGEVEVRDGASSRLSFELESTGSVQVEVRSGETSLGTFALGERGPGSHELRLSELDGLPPLADGIYEVMVTTTEPGGSSTVVSTWTEGRVSGVDLSEDGPKLLVGGRRVSLDAVEEVRTTPLSGEAPPSEEENPPTA